MSGRIPQQVLGLVHVRLAVPRIPSPEVAVYRLDVGVHAVSGAVVADECEEVVERGALAYSRVVDLVAGFGPGFRGCYLVYLRDTGRVAELEPGIAVTAEGSSGSGCVDVCRTVVGSAAKLGNVAHTGLAGALVEGARGVTWRCLTGDLVHGDTSR